MGRRRASLIRLLVATAAVFAVTALGVAEAATSYTAGTPSVDGVLNAPWNTSQGDVTTGVGSPYYTPGDALPTSPNLFPTFSFANFSLTPSLFTTIGGVTEPNVSVYGGSGAVPYASGVAGTPGPVDGYCSPDNPATGLATAPGSSPLSEPPNTDLPMSPYYFPDIISNGNGTLTGYFDWRPKDTDEEVTVATSSDGGLTWTTVGTALEQNPGYCPSADTNDDGQGHPFVGAFGSSSYLYTLQRAAGDNTGVGLLVHSVNPSASDPLATVPASEPVGIDPNTFVTSSTPVTTSGGVAIPVSTLGSAGSPEQIIGASYEVVPAGNPEASSSTIINCTGPASVPTTPAAGSLTGCTSATGSTVTVNPGDDLIQVIATANPMSTTGTTPCQGANTVTVPAGPNSATGTGGLSAFCFTQPSTTVAPITAFWWGSLAPDRVYIDGHTMYCNSVSSGLVKFENCTSPTGPFTATEGDAVTADPITPPTATMTTGLDAPDGIVGTLPNYTSSATYAGNGGTYNGQSVPSNATVVLYTEKLANYFIEGTTNGMISKSGNYSGGSVTLPLSASFSGTQTQAQWLNYQPSPTTSEPLPDEAPATGSFTVYVGVTDTSTNPASTYIQPLKCTSWEPGSLTTGNTKPPAGSINLIGCNGQGSSTETIASATDVGGPNAAVVPYSVISQIGEGKNGKTSGPTELFGNNEDYEAVRAAYTTDGINFTDLGVISGASSGGPGTTGTPPGAGATSGSYNDLSNPYQQASPLSSAGTPVTSSMTACGTTGPSCVSPANAASGSADTVELRWPGSRGTIIQNPDGSYGMFLSGAWPTDADSDAFNQIFYTSSTDGLNWSVPQVVSSTDYTFAASRAQETDTAADGPLGITGYYSGRDYGPAVVQNPNGTLTMVFAGYRTPKGTATEGDKLGTGSTQYIVGSEDPNLYRNILTATVNSSTSPRVATTSTVTNASSPDTYGQQVTYTDTVTVNSPGTGTPTGTVDFYDGANQISGCQNLALSETATDTATCQTTPSAGAHTITATYSGDSNYAASTNSPGFGEQVNPAPLSITASNGSMVYGGTVPGISASYSGFVNGDDASSLTTAPSCSTLATSSSSVDGGPYASSCSGAVDDNYSISYTAGSVAVTPASLEITASSTSMTYGGTVPAITASYSGFVTGDDASSLGTAPLCSTVAMSSSSVDGGPYASSCSGAVDDNYSISYTAGSVAVTPASLEITASSTSMTYGGTVPAITASYSGFVNGDDASSLTTGPSCSTVATSSSSVDGGPYASSCSGAVDDNYSISYTPGSVAVYPASLSITASSTSMTYGGTVPAITASYSGFVNGDDASSLTTGPSCSTVATGSSSVDGGPYPSTCSGAVDDNYSISYTAGSVAVTPASLEITASSTSMTYGGTVPAITASYSGFVNGDDASSLGTAPSCSTLATSSSSVDGGPYPSTCSGAVDDNYSISYAPGSVAVTPASLEITASSTSMTYGGTVPAISASYSGFVNGDNASSLGTAPSCSTAATSSSSVAGSPYASSCSGAVDDNYSISYVPGSVKVARAVLTVTADHETRLVNHANPTLGYTITGYVNGDGSSVVSGAPVCSTTATLHSGAGSYPITCTVGTLSAANYSFSFLAGTLTVAVPTLTVTASNESMRYGGSIPTLRYGFSGWVSGYPSSDVSGAPDCSTTATAHSGVGSYPISCTIGTLKSADYSFSFVAGTLTVTPAKLTVTADAETIVYGQAIPPLRYAISGFVNGDTSSAVSGTPDCTTTATAHSGAGSYPIVCTIGTLSAANYDFTFVAGTLKITRATLTVTANDQTRAPNQANPPLTYTITGFVNGDPSSVVSGAADCTTTAATSSRPGAYKIKCTAGTITAASYVFTFVAGTLTVT